MADVTIRSYCHGFGDCTFLRFHSEGREDFKVVIDCGLLKNTRDESARLAEVVEDLKAESDGKVDVLVITHEHYDHLSGFKDKTLWEGFEAEEVWMAWTEDPLDPLAQSLEKHKSLTAKALGAAIEARPLAADAGEVRSLMAFSEGTRDLRDNVVNQIGKGGARVKYFEPGSKRVIPNTDWFVQFLGPPKDQKKLRKLDEKSQKKGLEFLFRAAEVTESQIPKAKPKDSSTNTPSNYEQTMRKLLGLTPVKESSVFADQHIFNHKRTEDDMTKVEEFFKSYESERWRVLSENEGQSLSDFALQLDSMTNNTSLVLAFTNGRKTLLFPGDAQAGNWMSWGAALASDKEKPESVVAGEEALQRLLAQTVFYKVGHHGSHNGTYIKDRFEKMTNLKFVFMPFEPVAKWPSIPDPSLVALFKAEKRHFVRADESDKVMDPVIKAPEDSDLLKRPLWVEFKIED